MLRAGSTFAAGLRRESMFPNYQAPNCPLVGANEMTYSLQYLRQFMRAWQQEAATTRIFFPDQKVGD